MMNQRIRDLAVEAGYIVGELPLNTNEKIQLAGLEKFAELIVRKVFDCIADEGFEVYEPVIQSVKERFGVEE